MNDENIYNQNGSDNAFSAPVLDDIEYDAPSAKKDGPQGVSAPVLDDMDFVAPSSKKDGPQGVTAPVLDDFDDYVPNQSAKKGAPENVTAPVLDDDSYSAPSQTLSDYEIISGMTDEQKAMYEKLPFEKQQQILEMRRAQLGQQNSAPQPAPQEIKAPVLDDADSYVPPPKKEEPKQPEAPISAPILDDEPEPAKYVPKFADEDLERVKQEAKKKAVSSQLTSNQKDEKESLRMMLELKAEREAEAAKKGFKIVILLAFVGIIGAVLFYMLYSAKFFGLEYGDISANKVTSIISKSSIYVAGIAGASALLMITGLGAMKSLCSFIYLVFSVVQVMSVVSVLPQIEGSGIKWALFAGALICSIAVFVTLSTSDSVGKFYKKPAKDYNH